MRTTHIRSGAVAIAGMAALGLTALLISAGTPGALAQPPKPLDHFLCYNVAPVAGVPGFKIPPKLKLKNQFSTSAFLARAGSADIHCNPATKILPDGQTFAPKSPSWHLLCFNIAGIQKPATHLVQVTNQFGQADLNTGPPNQLCAPSLKSTSTPPTFTPPGPGEVKPDHFTCYPVTYADATRFNPPSGVMVTDQFNNGPGPIPIQILEPDRLCLPTKKTLGTSVLAKITNPTMHLLCFGTAPPIPPPTFNIWDQNQFSGATGGELTFTGNPNGNSLCLPSTKVLLH
jgi:hypothetical protein